MELDLELAAKLNATLDTLADEATKRAQLWRRLEDAFAHTPGDYPITGSGTTDQTTPPTPATVTATSAPTPLPLTVSAGTKFTFNLVIATVTHRFLVTPGTYATVTALAAALNTAFTTTTTAKFSTFVTVTVVGGNLVFTTVITGTAANSYSLTGTGGAGTLLTSLGLPGTKVFHGGSAGSATGSVVITCGGPTQGRQWQVRQLLVAGPTQGSIFYYVGATQPQTTPFQVIGLKDTTKTRWPAPAFYGTHQFIVNPSEKLWVVVTGATADTQVVVSGTAEDYELAAVRAAWSE